MMNRQGLTINFGMIVRLFCVDAAVGFVIDKSACLT